MPTFAASKRGYENMWKAASVLPSYKARAQAAAKKIIGLKSFYEAAEKATGAAWWWIGCIHYREADCNPRGCLANGDPIVGTGRRTTNVPAGRGPYADFAESAVDALRYEGLIKPQNVTAWYLWAAEKINGFVNARNSSYIWSGTTKMDHGMWVRDHVFDRSQDDPRPGVAAIMKELFSIEPSLEPKSAAPTAPIVVSGSASIPAAAAAIHLGDPSYAIGAASALAVILAHWAFTAEGAGSMNPVIGYILGRLREPSTYAGAASALAAFGVAIPDPTWQLIVQGGMLIGGIIAAITPDRSASLAKK